MTPTEFLKAVWPDYGYYCIATPFVPPNQTKSVWAHKVFQDIDEAVAFVEKQKETKDIFFCIHSLKEEKVWNERKTNMKTGELGAYEVRTQANTFQARAFFFDLDVDAKDDTGKKYASQAEALTELREFCKATQLPKPLITSSGGGLHVYWLVEDPINSTDWRQHAHKLRLLANHYKLRVDPSRTTDTASVLRVAGTYNHKRGQKRPVQVLSNSNRLDTERFLRLIDNAVAKAGSIDMRPLMTAPVDDDWGNLKKEYDGPAVRLKAVVKTCGIMADLLTKKGNFSEPEWYVSLGVVQYCENGDKLIHNWSAGHPDYSPDATEAKAAQWKNRSSGPASCSKLQEACGADACQTCPFYGKDIKDGLKKNWGPLFFARQNDIAAAPVVTETVADQTVKIDIPAPPYPYERLHSGEIVMSIKNKEGEAVKVPILSYDLYPISRLVNSQASIEQQTWRVHLPRSVPKDFVLDSDALYDRKKFLTTVANQGIYPSSKNVENLKDYMIAYIAKLQAEADAEAQCNHLGWTDDFKGFIFPDKVIMTDGTTKSARLSTQAARVSTPIKKSGTLHRQVELMNFYNHKGYTPAQFVVCAGLAAPIFYATGQHGTVINASGDTGVSKSTSIYAAASFWGDPEMYTLNGTAGGATARARDEAVITLANLPVCVDEITHMTPQEAANLAMNITQPGYRRRLGKDGVEKAGTGGYKATLMLSSANSSLHNLLSANNTAGTAGSMRVVEIYFKRTGIHSKIEADSFLREIKKNYGHIGEIFMSHVLQNREAVENRVIRMMERIDMAINSQSGERFWSAAIASVIVASEIAKELKLLPYNSEDLLDWSVHKLVPYMRGVVNESYNSPVNTLADYLETINADILISHKPYAGGNIPSIAQKPRGQLLGHYEPDDKRLWILKKGLRDYCTKTGTNYHKMIDDLSQPTIDSAGKPQFIILHKDIKKVLGAGTEYAKAQSRCICINMAHPEVSGVADLSVVASNPEALKTPSIAKLKPL
jgi:hypothetical protein